MVLVVGATVVVVGLPRVVTVEPPLVDGVVDWIAPVVSGLWVVWVGLPWCREPEWSRDHRC